MQPLMLYLAAEETASSGDPLTVLLQYGVLGVFAVLLIVYTRGSISREREKSDQAAAKVDELNGFIRDELLPKQVEAALLHKQVAEVLEEAIQLITEIKIRDNIARQQMNPPPHHYGGPRGG